MENQKSFKFIEGKIDTGRMRIAYLECGNPEGFPLLALHGWLDNAATFAKVAPLLDLANIRFIALDLPGHGLSEHRPSGDIYHLLEYVVECEAFARAMNIRQFDVLGHSLGGVIGLLWAAGSPNTIRKLALIDSLGPFAGKESKIAANFQEALEKTLSSMPPKKPIYQTIEDAITARMSGIGNISREAASCLVERGIKKVAEGFTWRSDARLTHPSLVRFTEGQIEGFISGVECEVLCILASKGFIAVNEKGLKRLEFLKNQRHCILEGGHHLHLDDAPQAVAIELDRFFQ